MAKESVSVGEKIYNVPLRSTWVETPRLKRGRKSVNTVRIFLKRHTRSDNIKISQKLSEKILARNVKNPPAKIRIKVKEVEGFIHAMLPEETEIARPEKKIHKKARGLKERLLARREESGKKGEKPKEGPKAEKREEIKAEKHKEAEKSEKKPEEKE